MKILYFAWLRTAIGAAEEEIAPPPDVKTVSELLEWLRGRGPGYAEALGDLTVVRVAVNQEFAEFDKRVAEGDEVALFPPMTGG